MALKICSITLALLAALMLVSCSLSPTKASGDAEQATNSVGARAGSETGQVALRFVISGKHHTQTDSVVQVKLKLPLDSIAVEMVNNTDSTIQMGEDYVIEYRAYGKWEPLPNKKRKDGGIYTFNAIGYELAPRQSRRFTIRSLSNLYYFEHGKEYRIGKDYRLPEQKEPLHAYRYFTLD